MYGWFIRQWQFIGAAQLVLIPLSWLFGAIVAVRRYLFQHNILASYKLAVPVIVVGNISVGGTGKTPVVIYLAQQLKQLGYTPGIISRGYGGSKTGEVSTQNAIDFGDEPVLIAKRTNCPVWVNANRVEAGRALLLAHPNCNVIISDDGLQHYGLQRDVEIALVDSFGNQQLLPAGPLRENVGRLKTVDAIVNSGQIILDENLPSVFTIRLQGNAFAPVAGKEASQGASYFANKNIVAVAGIGNPQRFFKHLIELGLQFQQAIFDDHHAFSAQDFVPFAGKTILMTEKDAVKCNALALADAWYLPVSAEIGGGDALLALIKQKIKV